MNCLHCKSARFLLLHYSNVLCQMYQDQRDLSAFNLKGLPPKNELVCLNSWTRNTLLYEDYQNTYNFQSVIYEIKIVVNKSFIYSVGIARKIIILWHVFEYGYM